MGCAVVALNECRVVSRWRTIVDQAEDGIRDLVRSRGLGDVYKRQLKESPVEVRFSGAIKKVSLWQDF